MEHFIATAAGDPETVAVKMTAYRIGDDTPFVKSLVKAAEALPGQIGDFFGVAAGILAVGGVRPKIFFDEIVHLGFRA